MTSGPGSNSNLKVATIVASVAVGMIGVAYASVPLYDLFCRVTGFGGTTQVASEAEAQRAEQLGLAAGGKTISIRFDASVARDVPWSFRPAQSTDTIQIGVRDMATYVAKNNSNVPITGTATFNVEPEQAGRYFNKIQCFCFTEQTLQPGEEVHMPVLYFVDPAALEDENMKGVEQITLSYTFHRAMEPAS